MRRRNIALVLVIMALLVLTAGCGPKEEAISWMEGSYDGDVRNGVPHGQGTLTFPNGTEYTGVWENGEPYGQGTWSFPDGSQYTGGWQDGEIVN